MINFLNNDNFGVPSTILSIWLNIVSIMNPESVNLGFTIIISSMSAVYLYWKIKLAKRQYKNSKDSAQN